MKFGNLDENDLELKKTKMVLAAKTNEKDYTMEFLRSSSSWYKIWRNVCWLLRFKGYLKNKNVNKTCLAPDELVQAEVEIFKYIQLVHFEETILTLKNGSKLKKGNFLLKLYPYLDKENILRVGGRIENACTPYEVKHPIILPKNESVVNLMVRSMHFRIGHLGKETLLAKIRNKYWIIGANVIIKNLARSCIVCRRLHGKPSQQIMAELPPERLAADEPPFFNTGVDAFGPFLVSRGRTQEKRYGLIFTCMTSRAMHIEIAFSLNTDAFINALRRFIARRNTPKTMRSDNGTNFVGSNKELKESIEVWNNQVTQNWMLQAGIEWNFNPPSASHFGGIWEREIRSIRKVFNSMLIENPIKLTDETLNTLMCEVEAILNSRPLTANSSDPNDLEPITPNHLLLAYAGVTFPPGLFNKDDIYARRKWRQIQYLADQFWIRWKREYLPLLQLRQKWTSEKRNYKIGDLVLVIDYLLPRCQWPLGRITKVNTDNKDKVRTVEVKVRASGKNENKVLNTTILQRPISKLVLLKTVEDLS